MDLTLIEAITIGVSTGVSIAFFIRFIVNLMWMWIDIKINEWRNK